jgi:hypothetical protein
MAKKKNSSIGSSVDDFLHEEKIAAEVEALAVKRVISWQIQKEMENLSITKMEMAKRMRTSRAVIDRLLDPDNTGLTLKNLEKAAYLLNKKVKIELV